jgi:xyloglucan:xyloglucosyl transferase
MRVYSSLWNGETWATEGGRIKVNWTYAPFVATFQNYNYDACEWTDSETAPPCANLAAVNWWEAESYQTLTQSQANELKRVQETYMVYDYCTDTKRWNVTPAECASNMAANL